MHFRSPQFQISPFQAPASCFSYLATSDADLSKKKHIRGEKVPLRTQDFRLPNGPQRQRLTLT